MRVLGIIPARGGSKGIPKKNITPLLGRPLIAYTARAAAKSERLDRVILSTDDDEIAKVAESLGIEVPFRRPPELALDDTPMIDVLLDALERVETRGDRYDAIFCLQPTNPLRRSSDIDGAIELLERSQADSVISFVDVGERHPARMKVIDGEGRVRDPEFSESAEGLPRQRLPKYYLREGSVYVTRRDILVNHRSIKGSDCRAWIMPAERACNIDEPFDLFLAEHILQYYGQA